MTRTGRVFDESIEGDPWVLYHGTSNLAESSVIADGLAWRPTIYSRAEVVELCSVFKRLGWAGSHLGGYAVLHPFSLSHDFGADHGKPIFLAETAHRAALFATRDFAGGETARAIYYAIADLRRLAAEELAQQEFLKHLSRNRSEHAAAEAAELLGTGWLEDQLTQLSALGERVLRAREAYTHGLVFAIRFDPPSLQSLCLHSTMGVRASRPIRPNEIVAVATIAPSYEHDPLALDSSLEWPTWSGISRELRGC